MVPFLTKKKSFNRLFPNGIGSFIADDTEFVIIRARVVIIKVPNILDDNAQLKVTCYQHKALYH